MRLTRLLVSASILTWSLSASAQTWSGTVRDIRSLAPVAEARVCAGIQGRVDLACTSSDADGAFSVSYPEEWTGTLGDDGLYHLFVESPVAGLYYHQRRARVAPGVADCRLVPRTAYVRGRVVNADTGELIPGMGVALIVPGATRDSTVTDDLGEFALGPFEAFENAASQFNTYGVEPEDLPPEHDGELVYRPWGLSAPYHAGGYALVEPTRTADDRLDPELPLLSSSDPEVFTWVEIRLPPAGTVIDDVNEYMSSQIGEPEATGGTGGTGGTVPQGGVGNEGGVGRQGGASPVGGAGGAGAAPGDGGTGEVSATGGAAGDATAAAGSDATGGTVSEGDGGTVGDSGTAGDGDGGTAPDNGGAGPASAGATEDGEAGAAAIGVDDGGGDGGDEAGSDGGEGAADSDDASDDDTDVTCSCRLASGGHDRPWRGASLGLIAALWLVRRRPGARGRRA